MEHKQIKKRIQRMTSGQPVYPALLKEIRDYPKELYYIGDPKLLEEKCVSIVGSRKTNQYGRSTAYSFGKALGQRGITVVSGMAVGIDTCSHEGALQEKGNTAAVLACGLDLCYPPRNRELKGKIESAGIVLSEYPPGTAAQRYYFPQRNRIISGLSPLTVVVQAGNRSGALITAELAADQGRDVGAVPGNIDSEYNLGSNKLLREGAFALTGVQDLLEASGVSVLSEPEAERMLSDEEKQLYFLLCSHGEMSLDQLAFYLKKPVNEVGSLAIVMEMKGIVFSAMGKVFIAKA
ncbi:DNA-protecting protein DprA [Clostridiales Family XIII bacterium BX16]|uniref:DNA-protecting protein DprA n=1 Tax=Lentihominibacter faecis TaxID=2764712 RepID=A0A923NAX9_9FIRM|nr:DNA-processing protein DprA [Lentihominibacter faecis]MBC5998698.1 DNA-protecting protein DprA [Lentihominibacter faecis]